MAKKDLSRGFASFPSSQPAKLIEYLRTMFRVGETFYYKDIENNPPDNWPGKTTSISTLLSRLCRIGVVKSLPGRTGKYEVLPGISNPDDTLARAFLSLPARLTTKKVPHYTKPATPKPEAPKVETQTQVPSPEDDSYTVEIDPVDFVRQLGVKETLLSVIEVVSQGLESWQVDNPEILRLENQVSRLQAELKDSNSRLLTLREELNRARSDYVEPSKPERMYRPGQPLQVHSSQSGGSGGKRVRMVVHGRQPTKMHQPNLNKLKK